MAVSSDGFVHQLPDIDPTETQEWLDSLDAVTERLMEVYRAIIAKGSGSFEPICTQAHRPQALRGSSPAS